jgi:hypothetical protein
MFLYLITLALLVNYIINEQSLALISLTIIAGLVYVISKSVVIALFVSIIITNLLLAMNLLLDLKNVLVANIFFMETKPNILFDGIFTKINYCDEFFTMYGVYVSVPIELVPYAKTKIDISTINALVKLESDILQLYATGYCRSEELLFRIKTNEYAIMFEKDNIRFWTHIRNNEFDEIFVRSELCL